MQFNIDNNSNKSQKMFTASLVIGSLVVELYIHVLYLCYGSQLTFELQVVTKVSRRLCSTCINGNSRYKSLQCTNNKCINFSFCYYHCFSGIFATKLFNVSSISARHFFFSSYLSAFIASADFLLLARELSSGDAAPTVDASDKASL